MQKSFRDIKGQNRAITLLQKAYKNDVISHSYIFFGPSGVGKSLVAKNFVKLINCDHITPDINPCGVCKRCVDIEKNRYVDLYYIKPKSSKEIIKIDQIREIEKWVSYKNYQGRKKVVLIESANQMNSSSFNALLKTLEEPPKDTVFILTTSSDDSVPETIKSRCQNIFFNPLREEFIFSTLYEQYRDIDEKKLRLIAKLAQGSITNGKKFIENSIFDIRVDFLDTLLKPTKYHLSSILSKIKFIVKEYKGEKFYIINLILEFIKTVLRDSYFIKLDISKNRVINSDYIEEIKKISEKDKNFLIAGVERLNSLQAEIITNIHTEMALENFFIDYLKGEM